MKPALPLMLLVWSGVSPAFGQSAGVTTRVTVTTAGAPTSSLPSKLAISADGRFVAFASLAPNLVAGDTNQASDVFVRDLQAGTTTRVSRTATGAQAKGISTSPSISADGRYIAFQSGASNLIALDTNGQADVFVHDRQTGTTSRASVSTAGRQANWYSTETAISADGRVVAYTSVASNLVSGDTNGWADVFLRDLQTNQTTRLSVGSSGQQANHASGSASFSVDARFVVFGSGASNLVTGDTNARPDIFVRDRQTDQTTRVSVATGGTQSNGASVSPSISADGRVVAFESLASNLVTGDTNNNWDVFVHDRTTGETSRINVSSMSAQATFAGLGMVPQERGHPSISGDGRFVAFVSRAANLVANDINGYADIFVRDRQASTTERLVRYPIDGRSWYPAFARDGRMVAFASNGANLPGLPGTFMAGVFVHDRLAGTGRVSVTSADAQATADSSGPSVDATGRLIAFASGAPDLVPNDTNGLGDIFIRDRVTWTTTRVSLAADGSQLSNGSSEPALSANGGVVAFRSEATNVVSGDTNGTSDIFARDLISGAVARVSVTSTGVQGNGLSLFPAINGDGRYVAFISRATNLVPGDANGRADVFLHDRQTGGTSAISIGVDGRFGDGESQRVALSGDGRFVVFSSLATNLISGGSAAATSGIFVRDRDTGITSQVDVASDGSRGSGYSGYPSISQDGRYVAFESTIKLAGSDTNSTLDIFVRDRTTGQTTRVSVATGGTQADQESSFASISGDGRFVAFESRATNLIADDTNGVSDIFVHDRATGQTRRVSVSTDVYAIGPPPIQATGDSRFPSLSADGRVVAFQSAATDLIRTDTNAVADIFVNDRGPW